MSFAKLTKRNSGGKVQAIYVNAANVTYFVPRNTAGGSVLYLATSNGEHFQSITVTEDAADVLAALSYALKS